MNTVDDALDDLEAAAKWREGAKQEVARAAKSLFENWQQYTAPSVAIDAEEFGIVYGPLLLGRIVMESSLVLFVGKKSDTELEICLAGQGTVWINPNGEIV